MKDYWKTYHNLQLKYEYNIPDYVDKRFQSYVCNNLSEFAFNLKHIKDDKWSIHFYYNKNQHYYRLKLMYKGRLVCSYYYDNNVIKTGKLCNKVPKQIDRFMSLIVSQCWNQIITYVKNKENVFELFTVYVDRFVRNDLPICNKEEV